MNHSIGLIRVMHYQRVLVILLFQGWKQTGKVLFAPSLLLLVFLLSCDKIRREMRSKVKKMFSTVKFQ